MDDTRQSVFPVSSLVSFTIAMVGLGITSVVTFHRGNAPEPPSLIHIYNLQTMAGLSELPAIRFNSSAKTNRTLWETVSTNEFHAGVQRVEPLAWIPSHKHETEEVIVVLSGSGALYDESGVEKVMDAGSMVHVDKHCMHTIRNLQKDQPLLLAFMFPRRLGLNKFQFRDKYDIPCNDDGC